MLLFSAFPLIFTLPLEYIFFAMEKTAYLFMITVFQTLSLFVTIPLFVNKLGVIGGAYGKIISFVLTFIIYFFLYRYRKKSILDILNNHQ